MEPIIVTVTPSRDAEGRRPGAGGKLFDPAVWRTIIRVRQRPSSMLRGCYSPVVETPNSTPSCTTAQHPMILCAPPLA
jgi:hypothetical protein